MPRAPDGSYSLPSGSLVAVGEDIVPSQHNPPLQDIAGALTGSLSRDGAGGMRNNLNMGGFRATNMAPGVQPTDGATVAQISGLAGVPVGFIGEWPSATPPTGWLICAGQSLSRTDYAALFAVIGTTFGAPSGSTFLLPDYRGRVGAGLDVDSGGFADRLTTPNSRTLGASGGAQSVTLTPDQMPAHTHTVSGSTDSAGAHTHSNARSGSTSGTGDGNFVVTNSVSAGSNLPTSSAGAHTHTLAGTADSAGGGAPHSNVQPTLIITKIIKVSNG
jgi:microcystin-dependent protein